MIYAIISIVVFSTFITIFATPLFKLSDFIIWAGNHLFNLIMSKFFQIEKEKIKPMAITPLMKISIMAMFLVIYVQLGTYIISSVEGKSHL
jgi:hypothetical protein